MSMSLFSNTPSVIALDNRGLIVRSVTFYRHPDTPNVTDTRITSYKYGSQGFLIQSADPRLGKSKFENFKYLTDLSGNNVYSISADSGGKMSLNDAAGRPLIAVSNILTAEESIESRSQTVIRKWHYDSALQSGYLLSVTEKTEGQIVRTTERFIYGGNTEEDKSCNLAGRLVCHYDTAGRVQISSVSLSGTDLLVTRSLLKNADALHVFADWQGQNSSSWNELLAEESFTTLTKADALGAVLITVDAKGNQHRMSYAVTGQLSNRWLMLKGGREQPILKSLKYTATGRKLCEVHGNGVITTYAYEAVSQHPIRIIIERPDGHVSGARVLQDIHYEYDPVGNVLSISNNTEQTRFWRNQKVVPDNRYVYDSLYQLVRANGREMANAGRQSIGLPSSAVPIPVDNAAFTNYTRKYTYDHAGNLTKIRHIARAANNNYTTNITVSDRSNRSVISTLTEKPSDVDKLFMAGGQQRQLQPGQQLCWNAHNELLKVTPVERAGSAGDIEFYRYTADSSRILKVSLRSKSAVTQKRKCIYLPGLEQCITLEGSKERENLQTIVIEAADRVHARVLRWNSGMPADVGNDMQRYSYDCLAGNSQLELDGDGHIISLEEYYPYGGTAILTARSKVEAGFKSVRYSGKERDATGLYYYGYRYYQPWVGRWLSADPAGTVDGLNLFRMVRNNPITLYDSDGRLPSLHEQKIIDEHAMRAGLNTSIKNYQQAFHNVYAVYGNDAYNELWYTLNQKIPLNSTADITHEHMASIADFIEKMKIISGIIKSKTTPENISINSFEVRFHLQSLPLNVLRKADTLGQFITVTNDNITNHPERNILKGVTPRGWNNGITWDTVPGAGALGKIASHGINPDETVIALTQSTDEAWHIAGGSSTTNLVLHEYGHAIDRSFGEKANLGDGGLGEKGDYLSRRRSFRAAWQADLSETSHTSNFYYYWQGGNDAGAEEAFAEGFGDLYSDTNKYNWKNIKSYISNKMRFV